MRDWHHEHAEVGRKPPSFAYNHAFIRPPDRNNHPLWQAATDRKKDDRVYPRLGAETLKADDTEIGLEYIVVTVCAMMYLEGQGMVRGRKGARVMR